MGDLFEEKKAAIEDKRKSYLSKMISKKAKFSYNLAKKRPGYILKATNDMKYISELIAQLKDAEQIHLMSNAFDSPSIIFAINKLERIKEIVCSTWAITDRGLQVFQELNSDADCYLLLDKTYSYKWVFESGAIAILQNIKMKFTENHSKCILIKTEDNYYSFVGSMNLSNNPRIENIMISNSEELYNFYSNFIKDEFK